MFARPGPKDRAFKYKDKDKYYIYKDKNEDSTHNI